MQQIAGVDWDAGFRGLQPGITVSMKFFVDVIMILPSVPIHFKCND